MKKPEPEWYAYRIGEPPSGKHINNDCAPFDSVHYNCHISDAFRVFAECQIQSSLVWDESKLQNTRTCVSWVSANTWNDGSIYGNIRFKFDWKKLVERKTFYWVEAMPRYNPPAFRILVSENHHSDLKKYDVASRKGPLFYHSESATWYRNGGFTSEFLLDQNLPLSECMGVVFDDHHTGYCRKDGSQCVYLGKRDFEAGAELFAQLVGHNHKRFLKLFLDPNSSSKCLNFSAAQAYSHLKKALKAPEKAKGIIRHEHPAAPVLISAILDHYGFGRRKATQLCGLFKNTAELRLAFVDRMIYTFDVRSESRLKGEEEDFD